MHILIVCDYYQPIGGTEQYIISISQALEESDHRVSVIYGIKTDKTLNIGIRSEHFIPEIAQAAGPLPDRTLRDLAGILRSTRPDVAYVHNVANADLVEAISAMLPTIRYIHDHRFFCPKGDKLFLLTRKTCSRPFGIGCYLNTLWRGCLHPFPHISLPLIHRLRRSFDRHRRVRVVVASEYMRNCLVKNGMAPASIETIPYFSSFLGTSDPKFGNDVLFAGRVIRQKGLLQLIRSMKAWPDDLRLLVAGDGPVMPRALKAVETLNVKQRVCFLGNLTHSELQHYYANCLCVAVPSLWDEPFGIVGIEAMSFSKPVVAFNVGGIPDWLAHGINGYLAPPNNFAALGRFIRQLHEDRPSARRMGAAGRRIYLERFTRERHLAELLHLFGSSNARCA